MALSPHSELSKHPDHPGHQPTFALSSRESADVFQAIPRPFRIPLDDCMFYATLRRGFDVSLVRPARSYSEAVCMWPHPRAHFLVLPLTLPQAEALEACHPTFAFSGPGLHGQWRLEKKRQDSTTLTLELVRPLALEDFWAVVTRPRINPPWIEPCFARYMGVALRDLPAVYARASHAEHTAAPGSE